MAADLSGKQQFTMSAQEETCSVVVESPGGRVAALHVASGDGADRRVASWQSDLTVGSSAAALRSTVGNRVCDKVGTAKEIPLLGGRCNLETGTVVEDQYQGNRVRPKT
jgi:hypothetical protein